MKKIILIAALALIPGLMTAQGFKGFVDLIAGTGITTKGGSFSYNRGNIRDINTDFAVGLTFTEGYQITNSWFAGIGFGSCITSTGGKPDNTTSYSDYYNDCSMYVPLYADVRWTLDIDSKITPFVDLKLGYQFGVALANGSMCETWSVNDGVYQYDGVYHRGKGGLYLVPSIGVRFGKSSAFNLGLAYNPFVETRIFTVSKADPLADYVNVKSTTSGVLMLTLGADF